MMASEQGFTGPMSLGNPDGFTIMELAEKVLKPNSSKSRLVFKSLPTDDPQQRQPDISFAREILGWLPKVALDDGLKETITYFKKLLGA